MKQTILLWFCSLLAASGQFMYSFTNLAGSAGGEGSADGSGSNARFRRPAGLVVDNLDNSYVADSGNDTIRRVTPAGEVTTLAGGARVVGTNDGVGLLARFFTPTAVTLDSRSNLYVADYGNHTVRKVSSAGVVSTWVGQTGSKGTNDGPIGVGRLAGPSGAVSDPAGNLYVADHLGHTIRKVTPAGVISTLAGLGDVSGASDGTGSAARFNLPAAVALDAATNLYVSDYGNQTIRKITPAGVVTTLAGTAGLPGTNNGTGAAARFANPWGLAVDSATNVYVADESGQTIRKITPARVVTTLAGLGGTPGIADGTGSAARFAFPSGLSLRPDGSLMVSDMGGQTVRRVTMAGVVTTLAGLGPNTGSANGVAAAARFYQPTGVAVDRGGTVYVADTGNETIRKVSAAGSVTTWAGVLYSAGTNDGVGSVAQFSSPSGLASDNATNLYVADSGNHAIRKITPTGLVTTLAGSPGTPGTNDGTGTRALFNQPAGVAVDSGGNVFVADSGNHAIRKVTPAGVVTVVAGLPGTSGSADGTGTYALFTAPYDLTVDAAGNVYVADTYNHTIRKISPGGQTMTLAGVAGHLGFADGTGTSARFAYPSGVKMDGATNLFVADSYNNVIRRVTPSGVVTTIGGQAGSGAVVSGIGGAARFNYPAALAAGFSGNLYVVDATENVLIMATPLPVLGDGYRLNSTFNIPCPTLPGRTFTLEYKNTVTNASWTALPASSVAGDGASHVLVDAGPVPAGRFYRVRSQ